MSPYILTVGEMLDEFLNSIFGGKRNQTISKRAAIGERNDVLRWCLLCGWLHLTLRQHHCRRVLAGEPVGARAATIAGIQLLFLFVLIFYVLPGASAYLIYHCL